MSESAKTREERNPGYGERMSKSLRESTKAQDSYVKRRGKRFRDYGPLSDEHKAKMSSSLRGKVVSDETKEKISRGNSKSGSLLSPDGEVHHFERAYDICEKFGLNPSKVSEVLKGTRPHHKGWKRVI